MQSRLEVLEMVRVELGGVVFEGMLAVPPAATGLVILPAERVGRHSRIASRLEARGMGTLLIDLLSQGADDAVTLLAERLGGIADEFRALSETRGLGIGLSAAGTMAAAALLATARRPWLGAMVSQAGRADLVAEALSDVRVPTMLIVGGRDDELLRVAQEALDTLDCPKELAVVPGATHHFEEVGALDEVARVTSGWFASWLPGTPRRPSP